MIQVNGPVYGYVVVRVHPIHGRQSLVACPISDVAILELERIMRDDIGTDERWNGERASYYIERVEWRT